jgi:arylsulfatase A-like enzyme
MMTVPDDTPNVLFVLTDQLRSDWVGMTDVPVRTPNLSALADRGTWFRNAISPSPVCAPGRACLASGMRYENCGVALGGDFPPERETYYQRLRDEAGYHVMGCGKFDLHKETMHWGTDGGYRVEDWGFSDAIDNAGKIATYKTGRDPVDPYMAHLEDRGLAELHVEDYRWRLDRDNYAATFPTPLPEDAYIDNWIARQGLDLLDDAPEDRPWHLVVNINGPHEPMDVTDRMHTLYRDPPIDFPGPVHEDDGPETDYEPREFDAPTHQAIRRNYAAMIENIDRWLGRYLDELERRGELENTIVIFSSDHGEMLGDHGLWTKQAPHQPSVGVPMVVAGPGVRSGVEAETPTSLLDVHATCLDYAGLDSGDVDSRSMRPFLEGETETHREVARAGLGSWRLAFDGRYKLIEAYDHDVGARDQVGAFVEGGGDLIERARERARSLDPVLYDLKVGEHVNVADEHPDIVERLSEYLPSSG